MARMIEFSEWLRNKMGDMRATELAAKAGIDDGIISRALKGTRIPSPQSLEKIARVLRIPLDVIYNAAGVPVSQLKVKNPKQTELAHIAGELPESDIDDLIELARLRLRRKERANGAKQGIQGT